MAQTDFGLKQIKTEKNDRVCSENKLNFSAFCWRIVLESEENAASKDTLKNKRQAERDNDSVAENSSDIFFLPFFAARTNWL